MCNANFFTSPSGGGLRFTLRRRVANPCSVALLCEVLYGTLLFMSCAGLGVRSRGFLERTAHPAISAVGSARKSSWTARIPSRSSSLETARSLRVRIVSIRSSSTRPVRLLVTRVRRLPLACNHLQDSSIIDVLRTRDLEPNSEFLVRCPKLWILIDLLVCVFTGKQWNQITHAIKVRDRYLSGISAHLKEK